MSDKEYFASFAEESETEVFENDIAMYLSLFCEEQNIQDMRNASQAVWNAALMYIKRHVFNNSSILKSKILNTSSDISIMPSTYGAYNYSLVNDICDYYIYMCMMYDKEVSIIGFSSLTGINESLIHEWGNGRNKLSTESAKIYEKLRTFREESLSDKLATANKNPVGILAILNRHYAWNLPGVSRENTEKRALTAAELPRLDGTTINEPVSEPKMLDIALDDE